jgi:transcriptional regulator GlxA family with amidase domain
VEVAKSTLEKGRKSIFEIMNEVGYSDDKAFREVFKKITAYLLWITRRSIIWKPFWFRVVVDSLI